MNLLSNRLRSAAIAAPIVVAILWFGDPWFTLAMGLAALIATREFYALARGAGQRPLEWLGLLLSLAFVAEAYLRAHHLAALTAEVLAAAVLLITLGLVLRGRSERAAGDWAYSLAAPLYIGFMLGFFVLLRNGEDGLFLASIALLATFACDSAAYSVGRVWGRHKLLPNISPGKTWEGALGGLLGCVAAVLLLNLIFRGAVPYGHALALGAIIALFAQLGDLAESAFKRSLGVKDASDLIPGHGGLLDRLDSLVLTAAAVYYYVVWIIGPGR